MNIDRTQRAFRTAANSARAQAAATPQVSRATAYRAAVGVTRANSDDDKEKYAKDNPADGDDDLKDGEDDDTKKKKAKPEQDDDVMKGAAGSAGPGSGDFKPMKGNISNPFDSNADKGNTSAKNDTGAPDTPSGF